MCLKRLEKEKLLGCHNKGISLTVEIHAFAKWLFNYFYKKSRSRTGVVLKAVLFTGKNLYWSLFFNSEYCEICKSTYFEAHLRTATSENVFMKLRKT